MQTDTKTQREFRKAMLIAMVNIYYNAGKIDLSRYHAMLYEIEQRYTNARHIEVNDYKARRTAKKRSSNHSR